MDQPILSPPIQIPILSNKKNIKLWYAIGGVVLILLGIGTYFLFQKPALYQGKLPKGIADEEQEEEPQPQPQQSKQNYVAKFNPQLPIIDTEIDKVAALPLSDAFQKPLVCADYQVSDVCNNVTSCGWNGTYCEALKAPTCTLTANPNPIINKDSGTAFYLTAGPKLTKVIFGDTSLVAKSSYNNEFIANSTPSQDQTYTATVINERGIASCSKDVKIAVPVIPPTCTLTANPNLVTLGSPLFFTVTIAGGDANTFSTFEGVNYVRSRGGIIITPNTTGTKTYTAILNNDPNNKCSVEVRVDAPPLPEQPAGTETPLEPQQPPQPEPHLPRSKHPVTPYPTQPAKPETPQTPELIPELTPKSQQEQSQIVAVAPEIKCSDSSFTYDPVRKVCVPPTEVVTNYNKSTETTSTTTEAPTKETINKKYTIPTNDWELTAEQIAATKTASQINKTKDKTTSGTQSSGPAKNLHGSYIEGKTGPEILIYPVIIGGVNGLYYLIRKRRKQIIKK